MVGELLLLAAVAFAAGFGVGWTLRAALARAVLHDMEMVVEKAADFDRDPPTMILEPGCWTNNVESYRRYVQLRRMAEIVDLVPAEGAK